MHHKRVPNYVCMSASMLPNCVCLSAFWEKLGSSPILSLLLSPLSRLVFISSPSFFFFSSGIRPFLKGKDGIVVKHRVWIQELWALALNCCSILRNPLNRFVSIKWIVNGDDNACLACRIGRQLHAFMFYNVFGMLGGGALIFFKYYSYLFYIDVCQLSTAQKQIFFSLNSLELKLNQSHRCHPLGLWVCHYAPDICVFNEVERTMKYK